MLQQCQEMDENLDTDQSKNIYLLIRFEDEEYGCPDFITVGKQISVKGLSYERQARIVSVYNNYDKFIESTSYYKDKMIKQELLDDISIATDAHFEKDFQDASLQDEDNESENSKGDFYNCDTESKFDIEYNGVNVDEPALVKVEEEVFITLSPNNSQVPSNIFNSIDWNNYITATEVLLKSLFHPRSLATRTMTGTKRKNGKSRYHQLDLNKIEDIIKCVIVKCKTEAPNVRRVISKICLKYKQSLDANLRSYYRSKQNKPYERNKLMVQYQGDRVLFGPNETEIPKNIFSKLNWSNYTKAIESILSSFLRNDILVKNYLNTDKQSNPPELDAKKVEDILYIVNKKSGRDRAHIRFAIIRKWSALFQALHTPEQVTKDPDMSKSICFGPNNSKVKKEIFQLIDWHDYAAATRSLHYALNGGEQPAKKAKRSISTERISHEDESDAYENKINDIIYIVNKKCGVTVNEVKDVLYSKARGRQSKKVRYDNMKRF